MKLAVEKKQRTKEWRVTSDKKASKISKRRHPEVQGAGQACGEAFQTGETASAKILSQEGFQEVTESHWCQTEKARNTVARDELGLGRKTSPSQGKQLIFYFKYT